MRFCFLHTSPTNLFSFAKQKHRPSNQIWAWVMWPEQLLLNKRRFKNQCKQTTKKRILVILIIQNSYTTSYCKNKYYYSNSKKNLTLKKKKHLSLFQNLHLSLYLSFLPLLACTYLNNAWDLVLLALPLYVCLFKINRFMYSPIVSRFG